MSAGRRTVRATADFFEDLDRQLGAERGPAGEPSANVELLRIVDTFATGFDELPELIPGRHDYRIFIASGTLVPMFSVVGQLAPDDAVELVSLDIDLGAAP